MIDSPPLPDSIYTAISRRLKHQAEIRRFRFAVAALLVATLGTLGVLGLQHRTSTNELAGSSEVTTELQNIKDYLNANDLEDEYKLYALIDPF